MLRSNVIENDDDDTAFGVASRKPVAKGRTAPPPAAVQVPEPVPAVVVQEPVTAVRVAGQPGRPRKEDESPKTEQDIARAIKTRKRRERSNAERGRVRRSYELSDVIPGKLNLLSELMGVPQSQIIDAFISYAVERMNAADLIDLLQAADYQSLRWNHGLKIDRVRLQAGLSGLCDRVEVGMSGRTVK